jgi:hypothetical protein
MRENHPGFGREIAPFAPRGKDLIIEGWGGGNSD